MSLYQWLLFFHVTGAFFLIGGIVVAGILNLAALVKDRAPSEVAALYGLIRFAVPLIGAGLVLTLAYVHVLSRSAPTPRRYRCASAGPRATPRYAAHSRPARLPAKPASAIAFIPWRTPSQAVAPPAHASRT